VGGGVSVKPPTGLTAAARAAYSRAERELGEDATRFRTALLSYTYAVDLESRARAEWERENRPLIQVHGAAGVHPLMKLMLETGRSASWHGAQLGLDPASAKRINPHRRPGRPLGANSAPDRVALPPPMWRDGEPGVLTLARPGPVMARRAAATGEGAGDAAAINRARGRPSED
jgi:hypothetical protein